METSDVGHMVHLSRVKWSPSLLGGKSSNDGFLLVIERRYFPFILVILVVFPEFVSSRDVGRNSKGSRRVIAMAKARDEPSRQHM